MSERKKNHYDVQEWPVITENHWYALAITSAMFTALAILSAFLWIFFDGFDGESDLKKAQAVAPFGVALFALVTFCTVAWRGSVNVRQANQAEREGRAKLLQEGAKLLGEKDNPSHVSAGVATLEILVTGPDYKLAVQAMNLIADYVQSEMASSHAHRFRDETFAALAAGADLGREANRTIRCNAPIANDDEQAVEWTAISGVKTVQYIGGKVEGGIFGDFSDRPNFRYSGVRMTFQEDVKVNYRYSNCAFSYCDIVGYRGTYGRDNQFTDCDFSDCKFTKTTEIPNLKNEKNYFRLGHEPTSTNHESVKWEDHLLVKRKGEFVAIDLA